MARVAAVVIALCGCLPSAGQPKSHPASDSRHAAGQATSDCAEWTPPEPVLAPGGRPVYVESPSAVRLVSGVALFGYPTFVWAAPDTFWRADSALQTHVAIGAVFGRDGSVTPILPPGPPAERPANVIAVGDGRGGAHVFWTGVPRESATAPISVRQVWGARFGSDGWSTPEAILTSDIIRWNRVSAAAVTVRGETHVVVSGSRRDGGRSRGGIAHLHGGPGNWATSWIDTESLPPPYVALLAPEGRPWVIAFIGAVETPSLNVNNGAFVALSHDQGRTWGGIVLVRDFGSATAERVQLVATPEGALHMFWAVPAANAGGADRLEHLVSREGLTWQREADFPTTRAAAGFQPAVTSSGAVFLALRQPDSLQVRASEWDGRAWGPEVPLGDGGAVTEPRVLELGPDSLYLVWGRVRPSAPINGRSFGGTPVSWWARRVSECVRRK
jgi:hypothetical protein